MKRIVISTSVLASLIGLGFILNYAEGQTSTPRTGAAAPEQPHKVGLIDMAYLFSKYDKFNTLREDLKAEIDSADASLKAQLEKARATQAEMIKLDKNSPDYIAREKELTQSVAKIEAERKNLQREFVRKETKVYQTIYGEVTAAVEKYAEVYKYTLILRYSREETSQDDPQKVLQALQRQVVFSRTEDDITAPVLKYLNTQFSRTAGAGARKAPVAPRVGAGTPATSRN